MTLINIRNLGVTLGNPLFSKLNLVVNAGDRIGLVAANGRGKSTLLACITGALEPTEGEITRSRGLTVGHVAQNVPPALFDTPFYDAVLQALPADQVESECWRVDVVLESLDVPLDCSIFVYADDKDAKATVMEMFGRVPGLKPLDAGGMSAAATVEGITMLLIRVNRKHKSHSGRIRVVGL